MIADSPEGKKERREVHNKEFVNKDVSMFICHGSVRVFFYAVLSS